LLVLSIKGLSLEHPSFPIRSISLACKVFFWLCSLVFEVQQPLAILFFCELSFMKYTITNTGTDWLLKIWEPAPVSNNRELPFLYKVKLRFANEKDAQRVLEHYLYHQEVMRDFTPPDLEVQFISCDGASV